jgi:hypothetical protein
MATAKKKKHVMWIQETKTMVADTRRELKIKLAEVEAQVRRGDGGNTAIRGDEIKPPRFYGSMSWILLHH